MIVLMTHRIVALGWVLCSLGAMASAQPQRQQTPSSNEASSRAISLRALLQLQGEQEARLNRLYDDYAQGRVEQEMHFASRQRGRTPSSDDSLKREQIQAQRKIADTLLSKRQQAFKVLGAVQRSQLQAYSRDPRYQLKRDRYYQLLLLPVEDLGQAPLDQPEFNPAVGALPPYSSNPSGRSQGTGSYGVYGGYSYGGPSYGVYGTVGRGSVGVQAGIGRGGPSIGIGIGRVFGGLRF